MSMLGKEVSTSGLTLFRAGISAAVVAKGSPRRLDQFHAGFNTVCFPGLHLFLFILLHLFCFNRSQFSVFPPLSLFHHHEQALALSSNL